MQELVDRTRKLVFDNSLLFNKKDEVVQIMEDIESLGGTLNHYKKYGMYISIAKSRELIIEANFGKGEIYSSFTYAAFMFDNLVIIYNLSHGFYVIDDEIKNKIYEKTTISMFGNIINVVSDRRLVRESKEEFMSRINISRIKSARN